MARTTNPIPLVDLRAQYLSHKEEFDTAVARCLESTQFIGGAEHRAFRQRFSEFCGGGHTVLCGNGTDALYLALLELLGQGDGTGEVITVSHTFVATSEVIVRTGYRPVFVDIDPETYLMDVNQVEAAITPRTRGILPVHLYGQMVPMDRLMDIARAHHLLVIEDAAQAHGAKWQGKGPGQWGDAACFSFYPSKNLGAWGDGGAVFTHDSDLAARIDRRANHGRKNKFEFEVEGLNSRLDNLQAAILLVKLNYLEQWNELRRRNAACYSELLGELPGVQTPVIQPGAEHVFHLYVIQVEERDRIWQRLAQRGIDVGVHYPIPVHEQPAYSALGSSCDTLPATCRITRRILSLPLYPEITEAQIKTVVEALKEELNSSGEGT